MMSKAAVKSRWPKAYAVRYPHDGVWHIGDGYGGYECDLGSGPTAEAAWADAYKQENERELFTEAP
jgi:hypothetical protein